MSFLPTLAGGIALAAALFPDPTLEGSPEDSPCGRFVVSSRQAGDLAATLDAAASFLASEPRPFERCPDLVAALRALVVGLAEVGDFGRAGAACDLLARGTPLQAEDLIRCAGPALRRGRMEEARRLLAAFVAGAGLDPAARVEAATRAADVLEEAARFGEAAEFLDLGPGPAVPSSLVLRRIHNLLRIGDGDAAREAFDRAIAHPEGATDRAFLRDACLLFTRYKETGPASRVAGLLVTVPEFGEAEADTVVLAAEAASDAALAERAARRLLWAGGGGGRALGRRPGVGGWAMTMLGHRMHVRRPCGPRPACWSATDSRRRRPVSSRRAFDPESWSGRTTSSCSPGSWSGRDVSRRRIGSCRA